MGFYDYQHFRHTLTLTLFRARLVSFTDEKAADDQRLFRTLSCRSLLRFCSFQHFPSLANTFHQQYGDNRTAKSETRHNAKHNFVADEPWV